MYIKRASIDNFGKWNHKTVEFSPGLNVIYGENESGKSTLQAFLFGMLFGMEKPRGRVTTEAMYQKYEPWNVNSYYAGSLDFVVGDKNFRLERNFYHKERNVRLYNQEDGEELSVLHGDLEMLLGGAKAGIYANTYCVGQAAVVTDKDFVKQVQRTLVEGACGAIGGIDFEQAKKSLRDKVKQAQQQEKQYIQKREEQLARLELELELWQEELHQLQQKKEELVAEKKKKTERKIFFLPILGWTAKQIYRFWKFLRRKKEKEVKAEDILQEQIWEKQVRVSNLQEEKEVCLQPVKEELEVRTEMESILLALKTLDRAAGECYRKYWGTMQKAIGKLFCEITNGKYDTIQLTEEGSFQVLSEQKAIQPWQLSRGAMEQLYFSLRLGVGRTLFYEENLPLMLDETFCAYDEERLKQALEWLAKQKEQILLFSCQKRELELLEKNGIVYHRIDL